MKKAERDWLRKCAPEYDSLERARNLLTHVIKALNKGVKVAVLVNAEGDYIESLLVFERDATKLQNDIKALRLELHELAGMK